MTDAARALPAGRTASGGEQRKQKPSTLVYGAAEKVPASLAFLNALQHVAVMLPVLVFPLLVGLAGGLKPDQLRDLLSLSVVALGVGTLLQCFAGRYFGSGFLLTFVFTAAYLPGSVEAAKSGSMALVYGMTVFAGVVQLLLAQAIPRLRAFFPAEIAGLCVAEIGIILGTLGMRLMLGIDPEHAGPARLSHGTALGLGVLALMIALQVWGKGMLRMLSVFIGMIAGYLISLGTGIGAHRPLAEAASTVVFGLPVWPGKGLSFQAELIVPFVIGALACSLRALGDITISQKINDEHWVRPDMTTIRKGVAADGLGTIAAALIGSVGGNTYSSSVGIANASGVASRTVGYWVGGLLIALSLMPALVGFFMHISRPVIGAALVFTACFVLINGLQIITSRLLDARRIFVIGLSLTLSLSRDIFPEYYGTLPAMLHPFVASDLVVALLVAMILNALFRIGIKRRQSLSLTPAADTPEIVRGFFEQNGRVWGTRRDVIDRAIYGCDQAIEVIADYCELQGPIGIEAAFDEYNLDITLGYNGDMLEFPARRPTEQEIIENSDGIRQLGGYLLHRNADRVRAVRRGDRSVLEFHFSH